MSVYRNPSVGHVPNLDILMAWPLRRTRTLKLPFDYRLRAVVSVLVLWYARDLLSAASRQRTSASPKSDPKKKDNADQNEEKAPRSNLFAVSGWFLFGFSHGLLSFGLVLSRKRDNITQPALRFFLPYGACGLELSVKFAPPRSSRIKSSIAFRISMLDFTPMPLADRNLLLGGGSR